jgi:hypothetical protein
MPSDSLCSRFANSILSYKLPFAGCNYLIDDYADFWKVQGTDAELIVFRDLTEMPEYFTEKDISFMHQQWTASKGFKWQAQNIVNKKIMEVANWKEAHAASDYWEKYKSLFGTSGYCVINRPLFSIDGLKAVVYAEHRNYQGYGSGGNVLVYRYVPEWKTWIFLTEGRGWVS